MAYRQVFGVPGERSIAQNLVWADMVERSCFLRPTQIITPDGKIDPLSGATNEGRRLYFLETKAKVESKPIDTND
jgi:hypothetical protein